MIGACDDGAAGSGEPLQRRPLLQALPPRQQPPWSSCSQQVLDSDEPQRGDGDGGPRPRRQLADGCGAPPQRDDDDGGAHRGDGVCHSVADNGADNEPPAAGGTVVLADSVDRCSRRTRPLTVAAVAGRRWPSKRRLIAAAVADYSLAVAAAVASWREISVFNHKRIIQLERYASSFIDP